MSANPWPREFLSEQVRQFPGGLSTQEHHVRLSESGNWCVIDAHTMKLVHRIQDTGQSAEQVLREFLEGRS